MQLLAYKLKIYISTKNKKTKIIWKEMDDV